MGLIAFIKRLFHMLQGFTKQKNKQIKSNDINKNIILPPNNAVNINPNPTGNPKVCRDPRARLGSRPLL